MSDVTRPGRELHARFVALGTMTGKTAEEIVAAVGPPTSISQIGNHHLLQWQATGCHMALNFDEKGMFLNISHQYANYEPEPSGCATAIGIVIVVIFALALLLAHLS